MENNDKAQYTKSNTCEDGTVVALPYYGDNRPVIAIQPGVAPSYSPAILTPGMVPSSAPVVVAQPGGGSAIIGQPGAPGRWSAHLCDCCLDGGDCLHVTCCAPYAVGKNSAIVGCNSCLTGTAFCMLFATAYVPAILFCVPSWPISCAVHYPIRRRLRERYGINENCNGEDFVVTLCCPLCAVCQELREVTVRGERLL